MSEYSDETLPGFPLPPWFSPRVSAALRDPLALCVILIVVTSLFFLIFPGIDVWFSGLFYLPGDGFPAGRLPASTGLRAVGTELVRIAVIALVVVLLLKLAFPARRSLVKPRDTLFILATLIVGPGLVVNLLFKDNWGRARPFAVEPFAGSHPFTAAWHMSDACTSNCSFVSGEASSAFWLVTLAVLLPAAWRPLALKFIVGLAVLLSLNRIAAGDHFLSDVLLAWWFTLLVIALAWRWLYARPVLAPERLEADLTDAGMAIRRLAARIVPARK